MGRIIFTMLLDIHSKKCDKRQEFCDSIFSWKEQYVGNLKLSGQQVVVNLYLLDKLIDTIELSFVTSENQPRIE